MTGRSILSDTLAVAGLTILAKVTGAAKTVFSARYFGPGADLDAYLTAFLIPAFLADVLSGALSPALIPALIDARETGVQDKLLAVYSDALYRSFIVLSCGAALLAVAAWTIDPARIGIHLSNLPLARRMLLIMAPMLPLSAVGAVWRSVLNAEMRFGIAALSPVFTPVIAILFLLAAGRWGIMVLAFGSTAGILAELAVLAIALPRTGLPILPRWRPSEAALRTNREYGAIVAANLVMRGSTLIDQTAAAMLGSGSISVWNFGTRLVVVLLAIGPSAISTAILPRFSRLTARGQLPQRPVIRGSVMNSVLVSTVVMAIVAGALSWFSGPIVRIAFGHGAFTPADAGRVATLQAWALLQAPFAVGVAILLRFIASIRANRVVLPVSLAALGINAILDYILMHRYGLTGIALSAALVQAFLLAALTLVVFRATLNNNLKEVVYA